MKVVDTIQMPYATTKTAEQLLDVLLTGYLEAPEYPCFEFTLNEYKTHFKLRTPPVLLGLQRDLESLYSMSIDTQTFYNTGGSATHSGGCRVFTSWGMCQLDGKNWACYIEFCKFDTWGMEGRRYIEKLRWFVEKHNLKHNIEKPDVLVKANRRNIGVKDTCVATMFGDKKFQAAMCELLGRVPKE